MASKRSLRTALLIGINTTPGSSQLHGATTDAELMAEALQLYGFRPADIVVLLEGDATGARIRAEVASLATRTHPDGIAVFGYAGHAGEYRGGYGFRGNDGAVITAPELARGLAKVKAKMWVQLASCHAAGYDIPGLTGPGRVTVFATEAAGYAYELGSAGSFVNVWMVRKAMIESKAPSSVEAAFRWAKSTLAVEAPSHVPYIDDQIPGDLVLGKVTWSAPSPSTLPPPTPTPPPTLEPTPLATQPPPAPTPGGGILCRLLGCR